jgi:integrase/recombinase XerD
MSPLGPSLGDYLRIRRALGFKLERDAKLLAQFIDYLHQHDAVTVTVEHAVAWVRLPQGASRSWLAFRMSVVRGFAAYLSTLDPAVQVPPAGLFPAGPHRAVPYLYSDVDIAALLTAATTLRFGLQAATYQTLIGLLSVTGLRVGEAIGLDDADFDSQHGVLTVRGAKFGKSRQVPLHPSTVTALRGYQRLRDQTHPSPAPQRCWSRPQARGCAT